MKEGRAIAEGQEVNTGCVSHAIQCICMCQVSAVTYMHPEPLQDSATDLDPPQLIPPHL